MEEWMGIGIRACVRERGWQKWERVVKSSKVSANKCFGNGFYEM